MTPEQLASTIVDVLQALVDDGAVSLPDGVPTTVVVERPRSKEHGDYATNVALQLAKKAGTNPRAFAELVAERLRSADGIAAVDIAGPGFLNITVAAGAQGEVAADVLTAGAAYGRNHALAGERINVEFISANPTGPLHLGHTRWAAVGDALARVLDAAGAGVEREFYINDRGSQMDKFGASVEARAKGEPVPEDGYQGAYVDDVAQQVLAEEPGILDLPDDERAVAFREAGYRIQLAEQQRSLDTFRTHFDVWFSERSLHADSSVADSLEKLRGQGHVFDADGAVWMRTTDFGDDKDRVLIRSNGELTYFASDTAYYLDKRGRGFDRCIYLLGADHHGYVGRLRAMAACAGDDPDRNVEVMIGQLVKILQDGEELKLSKRAGTLVTLAGAGRPDRRRRAALHAGAVPGRLAADPRRRGDDAAGERQPRVLRAVRRRADGLAGAQRPRPRRARPRVRPGAADPREGGRAAPGARRVPAGGRGGGAAAGAAPGRALPREHRVVVPQVLRRVPGAAAGRRGVLRAARRPAGAGERDAHRVPERPRPARRDRARAHVIVR